MPSRDSTKTAHPGLRGAGSGGRQAASSRDGAALIVALWVLIILSLLIASFAFDMHIEAGITSYYRKRLKAQYLARAGVEWAKLLLAKSSEVKPEEEEIMEGEDEALVLNSIRLSRGNAVNGMRHELGDGAFVLDLIPEESRQNISTLDDETWEYLLEWANVPEDMWPELIDCYTDWTDANDEHQLNGAESDDRFYEERGYECKNAPLDTIDELLLIKGFDQSIVYGAPAEDEDEEPMRGIAPLLTVWGGGKINVNTASRDVLMTIPGIDELAVDDIISERSGLDGEMGTRDDGFESVDEVFSKVAGLEADVRSKLTTVEKKYVRIISMGEVQKIRSGIWAVLMLEGDKVKPVFWREEMMQ